MADVVQTARRILSAHPPDSYIRSDINELVVELSKLHPDVLNEISVYLDDVGDKVFYRDNRDFFDEVDEGVDLLVRLAVMRPLEREKK